MVALKNLPKSYVAMDLETTGLDRASDGIVEIAGVKVDGGQIIDTFQTLVNTDARISAEASAINGITRDMLEDAPKTAEAITDFLGFVGDMPLIGHNAKSFDREFIERACAYIQGAAAPNEWYDTLELATPFFNRRISLADLCREAGVKNKEAHRALSDAIATHECYQWLLGRIAETTTDARDFTDIAEDGPFHGEVICFTGDYSEMTRHELMALVCEKGGTPSNGVTLKTTMLVDFAGRESGKVKKARQYQERTGIRIVKGEEFCELAGIEYVMPAYMKNPAVVPSSNKHSSSSATPESYAQNQTTSKQDKLGCGPVVLLVVVLILILFIVVSCISGAK